jgi:hypothetical protein
MRFSSASILAFGVTAYTAAAFVAKPMVVLPKSGTIQAHSSSSRSVLSMAENKNDESIGFATARASEYESLGLPARSGRPHKIAIAGGGVGGLTTALCMLKKGFDVTVYEKTAAFARFGGPIQIASNALSVLKEIDDRLFDRVMDKFTFTGTRTCGIKDGRSIV